MNIYNTIVYPISRLSLKMHEYITCANYIVKAQLLVYIHFYFRDYCACQGP